MAVRKLLPRQDYGFIIRRDVSYADQVLGVRPEIAAFDNLGMALDAWPFVVQRCGKERLTLRNGTRLIKEHLPSV